MKKQTPRTIDHLHLVLFSLVLLAALVASASAEVYYVSPAGSAENPGTEAKPWSLAKANANMKPGDTAILADGVYSTSIIPAQSGVAGLAEGPGTPKTPSGDAAIIPAQSGEAGKVITYRAANRHKAVLTGETPIILDYTTYITIEGIKAENAYRWILGTGAGNITINDCYFRNAKGFESMKFRQSKGYIRVTNSHIQAGADSLHIREGRGHYVANNNFVDGGHTILILMGVTNSVVENNSLTNSFDDANGEKCMEVFALRKAMPPHEVKAEYNLIQNNYFRSPTSSGIQYAGNSSIIRRNVFDNSKVGMNFASYGGTDPSDDPEAWWDAHNRFYNNTIYDTTTAINTATLNRILPPVRTGEYGDNLCINNLIAGGNSIKQINIDWDALAPQFRFVNNNVDPGSLGDDFIFWLDANLEKPPLTRNLTIAQIEAAFPDNYSRNTSFAAGMVDPDKDDFNLKPDSESIDAGSALTKTTAAGKGTEVTVEDALFFTDGYGVIDADVIRIGEQKVTIATVDYQANKITLTEPIEWQAGALVFTDFQGKGPDLGAFEAKTN